MRILVVGGGSGGHVTPVAAVCKELKRISPDVELHFWCDAMFKDQAITTMREIDPTLTVHTIMAGKLRRYHGMSMWRQMSQVRTIVIPNIIDLFKLGIGFVQSVARLISLKPDVVFTKGGFVCLPVGIAAKLLSIPLVIHDSDAHPGLTNRILSRFATSIATGAPLSYYPYPKEKSTYIGIPVMSTIGPVTIASQKKVKHALGFNEHEPMVIVTGGGLGATRINECVMNVLDDLLSFTSVILIAGKSNKSDLPRNKSKQGRTFKSYGYVPSSDMINMMSAADIVVTRAGATTLLELAALHKATVIIPNEYLTGGHQIKNANVYEKAGAAVVVREADLMSQPLRIVDTLNSILLNARQSASLRKNIATLAKPDASADMAKIIMRATTKESV